MEKNANKLIREININQKLRLKVLGLALILFNCFLLSALIYLFSLITTIPLGIILLVIFLFCLWRSIVTFIKAKSDTKYVLFKNKLIVNCMAFNGEIDLETVFAVHPKRTLFDLVFRKNAHSIIINTKGDKRDKIMLSFINEDVDKLCDEIMSLAIKTRENSKRKQLEKLK